MILTRFLTLRIPDIELRLDRRRRVRRRRLLRPTFRRRQQVVLLLERRPSQVVVSVDVGVVDVLERGDLVGQGSAVVVLVVARTLA